MARRKAVVSLPQEKRDYLLGIDMHSLRGLRVSVCNGLLRLVGVQPGQVVVDSFAGSGNIPIECAVRFPGVQVVCCDADPECVIAAGERIAFAQAHFAPGSVCSCLVADAQQLPFPTASVDHFVSDLPFGNHTKASTSDDRSSNVGGLLPGALWEVARCLRPGGQSSWLLTRFHARQVLCHVQNAAVPTLALVENRDVVVAGWPCTALTLQRTALEAPQGDMPRRVDEDVDLGVLTTVADSEVPLCDGLQMWFPFHLTSQSAARKAVTRKRVFVNGDAMSWHVTVEPGSAVLLLPEYGPLAEYSEELQLLYEDSSLAVLVKPHGLPVHRGKRSLQNALRGGLLQASGAPDALNPAAVMSVMSREGGGVVLVAKTAAATSTAYSTTYQALVVGGALPENMQILETVPSPRFGCLHRVQLGMPEGELACRDHLKAMESPVVGEKDVSDVGRGLMLWAISISFQSEGTSHVVACDTPSKFATVLERSAQQAERRTTKGTPRMQTQLGASGM